MAVCLAVDIGDDRIVEVSCGIRLLTHDVLGDLDGSRRLRQLRHNVVVQKHVLVLAGHDSNQRGRTSFENLDVVVGGHLRLEVRIVLLAVDFENRLGQVNHPAVAAREVTGDDLAVLDLDRVGIRDLAVLVGLAAFVLVHPDGELRARSSSTAQDVLLEREGAGSHTSAGAACATTQFDGRRGRNSVSVGVVEVLGTVGILATAGGAGRVLDEVLVVTVPLRIRVQGVDDLLRVLAFGDIEGHTVIGDVVVLHPVVDAQSGAETLLERPGPGAHLMVVTDDVGD